MRLGDPVLLIERRGEQQLVYDGLVLAMSMDPTGAGARGEMMIDAVWVNQSFVSRRRFAPDEWAHALFFVDNVVHVSHRDFIEGRAGLGYEQLPARSERVSDREMARSNAPTL